MLPSITEGSVFNPGVVIAKSFDFFVYSPLGRDFYLFFSALGGIFV